MEKKTKWLYEKYYMKLQKHSSKIEGMSYNYWNQSIFSSQRKIFSNISFSQYELLFISVASTLECTGIKMTFREAYQTTSSKMSFT